MKKQTSLLLRRHLDEDELEKIIKAAKNEDKDALTKLCEYVYARIYGYIYYRVNHREDAEDLTSEVVLKVIRALKKQRGNFNAWIYKIAKNATIDFYRHRAVRSEVSISDMASEVPDRSVALNEKVLTQEKLRKGIRHLTEAQKQVIIMRFIYGYSNDEVAKAMGKSIGAIKVMQFRALKALRRYFRSKGYEIKD